MTTTATKTIDEQVDILMSGAAYGDAQTKQTMARELRERAFMKIISLAPDVL